MKIEKESSQYIISAMVVVLFILVIVLCHFVPIIAKIALAIFGVSIMGLLIIVTKLCLFD